METLVSEQHLFDSNFPGAAPGLDIDDRLRGDFHLDYLAIPIRTSGSTGTEISGRALIGKRPLHRLIDFAASEVESYQKGCRKPGSLQNQGLFSSVLVDHKGYPF
jgi:hypothetical protein